MHCRREVKCVCVVLAILCLRRLKQVEASKFCEATIKPICEKEGTRFWVAKKKFVREKVKYPCVKFWIVPLWVNILKKVENLTWKGKGRPNSRPNEMVILIIILMSIVDYIEPSLSVKVCPKHYVFSFLITSF